MNKYWRRQFRYYAKIWHEARWDLDEVSRDYLLRKHRSVLKAYQGYMQSMGRN